MKISPLTVQDARLKAIEAFSEGLNDGSWFDALSEVEDYLVSKLSLSEWQDRT